jgi:hypothetical protein
MIYIDSSVKNSDETDDVYPIHLDKYYTSYATQFKVTNVYMNYMGIYIRIFMNIHFIIYLIRIS